MSALSIERLEQADSLSAVLRSRRDPGSPVAFGGSAASPRDVRSYAAWRDDVADTLASLETAGAAAGARFALYDDDPYAFSVGLFALWQAGCVAVLPPNAQSGTLARLRDAVEGAVGGSPEAAAWLPGRPRIAIARGDATSSAGRAPEFARLDRDAAALELFTSGTTSEGKAVPKLLRHLDDEVRVLDEAFGAELGSTPVFATASHQHLYGLLFRVLWPLATARPFSVDRVLHAEELLPRLGMRAALASVPAHLDHLAERLERGVTLVAAGEAPVVFSSGGPLSAATAHVWERAAADAPTEVFGSTETGGVAWRRQREAEGAVPWTPFEGVTIEARGDDGRLHVRSSLISVGGPSAGPGFTMGDRVRILADGRFETLGRADRVLKVGEKRLSLPDMESRLRTHPDVAEAALVGLERAAQLRVGAVVVLAAQGREALASQGRRALGRRLTDHLARDFDRLLVPRVWRYVESLPQDAQGKTMAAALRAVLEAPAQEAELAAARAPLTQPTVLAETRGSDFVEQRCRVPETLAFLDGHFPGHPIVAGVVQLHWAAQLAEALAPGAGAAVAQRVEALKFAAPLDPGTEFTMRVERASTRGSLHFRLSDGGREFASGRLVPAATSGAGAGAGGAGRGAS